MLRACVVWSSSWAGVRWFAGAARSPRTGPPSRPRRLRHSERQITNLDVLRQSPDQELLRRPLGPRVCSASIATTQRGARPAAARAHRWLDRTFALAADHPRGTKAIVVDVDDTSFGDVATTRYSATGPSTIRRTHLRARARCPRPLPGRVELGTRALARQGYASSFLTCIPRRRKRHARQPDIGRRRGRRCRYRLPTTLNHGEAWPVPPSRRVSDYPRLSAGRLRRGTVNSVARPPLQIATRAHIESLAVRHACANCGDQFSDLTGVFAEPCRCQLPSVAASCVAGLPVRKMMA